MPGGLLTDNGETTLMKNPVEDQIYKPAANLTIKTEWNNVISSIQSMINLPCEV
jgi:hypothetical protein